MTRFDAATPTDRRSLVAAAVEAHRQRESVFCTFEADAPPGGPIEETETPTLEDGDSSGTESCNDDNEPATRDDVSAEQAVQPSPAWIQYSVPESTLNLDCTEEEYDRIADVLASASAFTIDDQSSPEDAEGRNLRITVRTDADRVAQVVDRIFVEGFDYPDDFRLWATEI